MSRVTLPPRRGSISLTIDYADVEGLRLKAHITYSRDGDGRLREVFISAGKPGSAAEAILRDAGLLISLLLQHGATLPEIRSSLTRGAQDQPASQVGVVIDALIKEEIEALEALLKEPETPTATAAAVEQPEPAKVLVMPAPEARAGGATVNPSGPAEIIREEGESGAPQIRKEDP